MTNGQLDLAPLRVRRNDEIETLVRNASFPDPGRSFAA